MAQAKAVAAQAVTDGALREFTADLCGQVLSPVDAGYDDARKVWNGMIDKRPGLIARCVEASDIVKAISFARANGLLVALKGGGHSFPGHSVCDGGLMIDMSLMKGLAVDPQARTATVDPGLTWEDFRPGDECTRSGNNRWPDFTHGDRGPHPRRGDRLAGSQLRPHLRQRAVHRHGGGRRPVHYRQRHRERGVVLGAAGEAVATSAWPRPLPTGSIRSTG